MPARLATLCRIAALVGRRGDIRTYELGGERLTDANALAAAGFLSHVYAGYKITKKGRDAAKGLCPKRARRR